MSDQKLKEIRKNPEKFESVYNDHYASIFNYCFRRTNNFEVSRDIAAEVFLKAFLNIKKFVWKGVPIKSWLYRIATNEVNRYFRSKHYRPQIFSDISEQKKSIESLLDEKSTAEREMEMHAEFRQVQHAVTTLPIKYQQVIALRYFENLKIKEIAAILGKKEGTIKSLLSRAVAKLKEDLV